MTEDPLQIICAALGGVGAERVVFERDPETGGKVAHVQLRPEQLESALRENGRFIREAAMRTGIDIDVGLAEA
jgi:transcription antitermination factor NusA-like protein